MRHSRSQFLRRREILFPYEEIRIFVPFDKAAVLRALNDSFLWRHFEWRPMQNGLFLTQIIANKTVFTVWPPGKTLFRASLRLHSRQNGVEFRGRVVHAQEPIALWMMMQVFAAVALTVAAFCRPVSAWLAAIQSVGSLLILALFTLTIVMTFAYGKLRRAASWLNVFLPGTVSRSVEKRPETGNGA